MPEVTRILSAIEQGDPQAAEKLLPLVYDELRGLAALKLAHEKPGQTLQVTTASPPRELTHMIRGITRHLCDAAQPTSAPAAALRDIKLRQTNSAAAVG